MKGGFYRCAGTRKSFFFMIRRKRWRGNTASLVLSWVRWLVGRGVPISYQVKEAERTEEPLGAQVAGISVADFQWFRIEN